MDSFLTSLRERFDSLSPVEKRIARAILDAPCEIVESTVTGLARNAGVSTGSVANFVVSFGFQGFTDMKLTLARQLRPMKKLRADDVDEKDDPKAALRRLANAADQSFHDTLDAMGGEMRAAAELLMKAPAIRIVGAGSSIPVMYDIHYRLLRIGLPVAVLPDSLLACLAAAQSADGDVIIAVSHKGRTENTLRPVQIARQHGAKIIALTSLADSPLARISDVTLVSVSNETVLDKEAVIARLTQLLLFDALCAWIAAQRGDDAILRLDTEIELLEYYRVQNAADSADSAGKDAPVGSSKLK